MSVGSGHETTLAIYNKCLQPCLAGIPEAGNEVLQIDDGADHAEEMLVGHDWSAHEHGRALIFAGAHRERLSVVAAPLSRGHEGMLQFALNKCIGNHAPCGDSFSFIVEE